MTVLVAFLHGTNLQCMLQDLVHATHGLHLILAHIRAMTTVTELLDNIVGSVTHLLHLVLIKSSSAVYEQVSTCARRVKC